MGAQITVICCQACTPGQSLRAAKLVQVLVYCYNPSTPFLAANPSSEPSSSTNLSSSTHAKPHRASNTMADEKKGHSTVSDARSPAPEAGTDEKYSIKDHWKCLAACTLVSLCPFQYGIDFGLIGGLQAMVGFLRVCLLPTASRSRVANLTITLLSTDLWLRGRKRAGRVESFDRAPAAHFFAYDTGCLR